MKSKQKNEIHYEYKRGNKVRTITTITGLKQYCTVNSLQLSGVLKQLGFRYMFDEFETGSRCRICDAELHIASIDVDKKLVYVKTHGCVVDNEPKITRSRFDTVLNEATADIAYAKYCQTKTKNYRPENCDCSSLNYYIKRYGEHEGLVRYHTKNEKLATTTLSYFLRKGLSVEDAKAALRRRQQTFSLEKCVERYGQIEGPVRWKQRQDKWQNTINSKSREELFRINASKGLSKQRFIDKHGQLAWEQRCSKMIQVMNDRGWIISNKEDHREYYAIVTMLTKLSKSFIGKCPTKGFHLDHIYSIAMGYRTRISPLVIGCPINLRWIPGDENQRKSYRCDIEKTTLLTEYDKWINTDDGKRYYEDVNALQGYLRTETTSVCE